MTTERIPGFCALCRSRCGCISVVEEGRLVAVEPDPAHPTGQHLCVKGRAAPELVYAPDRLLYPMKRTRPRSDPDPGWVRIGWDEALDWTAARMRALAEREGPESVAFTVTTPAGTAVSDGFAWINRLIRSFGSPNMVWGEEVCAWHRDYATAFTFGTDIGTRPREGSPAGRSPDRAADEVQSGHQSQDRQSPLPGDPAVAPAAGGSGDRVIIAYVQATAPPTAPSPPARYAEETP